MTATERRPVGPPGALPKRAGIGLKPQHVAAVLEQRPDIGFFEVHAENYMVAGGPAHHFLGRIRELYPLSLHGVGLSVGGEEPLDDGHLAELARLIDRYQPASFSEHLAWSSHGGCFFNDLLPLAYDRRTLQRVCDHVDQVQQRLGCRMLLENPSTYVEFEASTMDEPQFLRAVVARSGCGLLLDINNAYVSCINNGRDTAAYLRAMPLDAVAEIHLAGFAVDHDSLGAPLLIDSHGCAVADPVWQLFASMLDELGPVASLLERDNDVPTLAALLAEASSAEALLVARAAPAATICLAQRMAAA